MDKITVEATINAPVNRVWSLYTDPAHVTRWNTASDDWHSPSATNDLRPGGSFSYRMEAKDGSAGFDFSGTYDEVVPHRLIAFTMGDGRTVQVSFEEQGGSTHVSTAFDPESENSIEVQRDGWQSILDNFRDYVQSH
jgi:uncharacterized protein YndB with AHSA1/START domain